MFLNNWDRDVQGLLSDFVCTKIIYYVLFQNKLNNKNYFVDISGFIASASVAPAPASAPWSAWRWATWSSSPPKPARPLPAASPSSRPSSPDSCLTWRWSKCWRLRTRLSENSFPVWLSRDKLPFHLKRSESTKTVWQETVRKMIWHLAESRAFSQYQFHDIFDFWFWFFAHSFFTNHWNCIIYLKMVRFIHDRQKECKFFILFYFTIIAILLHK